MNTFDSSLGKTIPCDIRDHNGVINETVVWCFRPIFADNIFLVYLIIEISYRDALSIEILKGILSVGI